MSGVSRCGPWTFAGINRHPAPPASRVVAESRPDAGCTIQPPDSRKLHCALRKAVSPPSKPRRVVRNSFAGDGGGSVSSKMLFSMRSSLACWSSSDNSAMDARSASASCAYSSARAAHDSASWQSGGGAGAFGATCVCRRCVGSFVARKDVSIVRFARRQLFGRGRRLDRAFCALCQPGCSFGSFHLGQPCRFRHSAVPSSELTPGRM